MTDYFDPPHPPPPNGNIFIHIHPHEWVEMGARLNPNGTWSSVWGCTVCPDVTTGEKVGPIPPGYCPRCQWVQKKWPRKKCEECKYPFEGQDK